MARIRTVKPEFFRHGDLYELEIEMGLPIRVAFAGLWTAADKEGRFKWKPLELKLDCLPHDDLDFSRVLDALLTRGHIVKYAINGKEYGCIPSWKDHQIINNRESESVLPAPAEESMLEPLLTREARVTVASVTPLKCASVEGKGREGDMHASLTRRFDDFWKAYPKKKAKGDAEKAWNTIKPNELLAEQILQAVQRATTSIEWLKAGGQFIPYPATWLRDKGWLDEVSSCGDLPVWERS